MGLESIEKVAIIGGGIAGMAMALALQDMQIPCTVFEMRSSVQAPRTGGGALMVSPNSLRILDRFGIYERLLPHGYPFEYVWYKNAAEETIDKYPLGHEQDYGYKAMRVYRQKLLETMYAACRERGIPVLFDKKFARVVKEDSAGVEFALADGTTERATLLIGADGIFSKLRAYVNPGADVEPRYMGLAALTWATPTRQLRVPQDKAYQFPVTVTTANGAFVLAPQEADGSEMLAGTQFPLEDRDRAGWEALLADKEGLKARARQSLDVWPDVARSSIENIDGETLNVWPFRALPPLPRWTSDPHRRVVILGDAAHAVPPTTGQGASQAFEDVFTLALLVAKLREHKGLRWEDALVFWQKTRQERMDTLMDLTKKLNNKRLPLEKQALLSPQELWRDESDTNPRQMAWLYCPEIEKQVDAWVSETVRS
ncbi:FAD/NAD(P)-binding domain-containing protein [Xylariaceae sp. FL0016]|nr:FAD/NAD(P)-binding domain-containing protein [Xylariaceae sp. FL0016]